MLLVAVEVAAAVAVVCTALVAEGQQQVLALVAVLVTGR